MPSPTTADELLELVRKSGVVDEKRLTSHIGNLRAQGALPAEPGRVAGVLVRDGLVTHFQAEQFLQGKWRRFTIGKYKVLERLGSGGMGSVYLCEHKLMRRRVAVKVLPTSKAEDSSSLERFYREARAVAALDHPNIVRAYDIDQDDKLHFLVMELVEGASLQEIIKKSGAMDPIRAAHYIRQAALGLQHAHEVAGLVHRDIKPGNVLVDRSGIVKVLDMGLARFFHDEEDVLTKKYDENVLGTADYLAPEQALDSHGVDIRADIYSLGATFYFCLTGHPPFAEGSVAQKLIWHQTRQPKPLRSLREEVPEGIAAVIEKMMAKNPEHRYQEPAQVASALGPWTQTPIPPPPDHEMPQFSLAARGAPTSGEISFAPLQPQGGGPASPGPRPTWQPAPGSRPPVRPATPPPGSAPVQPPQRAAQPAPPNSPSPQPRPQVPVAGPQQASPAPSAPAQPPGPPPRSVAAPSPRPTAPSPAPAKLPSVAQPAPRETSAPSSGSGFPSNVPLANGVTVDTPTSCRTSPSLQPSPTNVESSWGPLSLPEETSVSLGDHRSTAGSSRKRQRSGTQSFGKRYLWWILGGLGLASVGFLSVILALVYFLSVPNKVSPPRTPPTRPQRLSLVVSGKSEGNEEPTLFSALRRVHREKPEKGAHILVETDLTEDPLSIRYPNITIEAAQGKKIRWKPSPRSNAKDKFKLLLVQNVSGFQLKGFELDGSNKAYALITVWGRCVGMELEDLTFKGFQNYGLYISNCMGGPAPEEHIVLNRLRFETKKKNQTCVFFDIRPTIKDIPVNRYITFRDCQFGSKGVPLKAPNPDFIQDSNLPKGTKIARGK